MMVQVNRLDDGWEFAGEIWERRVNMCLISRRPQVVVAEKFSAVC